MSPKLKKCLRRALGLVWGLALLVLMGWVFAPAFLVVDSGVQTADAVVVLGGESWTRPVRAAEVYYEVKAEMLKSGNADTLKSDGSGEQGAGREGANIEHRTSNIEHRTSNIERRGKRGMRKSRKQKAASRN